jgi:hypothetical protein
VFLRLWTDDSWAPSVGGGREASSLGVSAHQVRAVRKAGLDPDFFFIKVRRPREVWVLGAASKPEDALNHVEASRAADLVAQASHAGTLVRNGPLRALQAALQASGWPLSGAAGAILRPGQD